MKPILYPSDKHHIDRSAIDADALYVIDTLHDAGYVAYLVGGGVRDLLAGKTPKDFDISTSATPQEIKELFKRKCLLIGRRFRLAHIRFGATKFIEVATFRAGSHLATDKLIIHDNEWGSEKEDVLRRDFTMNGLFFDPSDGTLIDYVGGRADIEKGLLRSIGDPVVRFKQDPVRMIRLLKFKARFGYTIEATAAAALVECRGEITKSSPARIAEELYKMLESGSSEKFFKLMLEAGFLDILLPDIAKALRGPNASHIYRHLHAADLLIGTSSETLPDRAVLMSSLLFPLIDAKISSYATPPAFGDILGITHDTISKVTASSFPYFPRRIIHLTSFIANAQYRLTPLSKAPFRYTRMLHHEEFEHALEFLKLRTLADDNIAEHYPLWKKRFESSLKTPSHDIEEAPIPSKRHRRRIRKPR